MDRETIIKLARESGAMFDHMTWVERDLAPIFERFAKLVAEHEREACAKVCDDIDTEYEGDDVLATWCATAIRARGNNA